MVALMKAAIMLWRSGELELPIRLFVRLRAAGAGIALRVGKLFDAFSLFMFLLCKPASLVRKGVDLA